MTKTLLKQTLENYLSKPGWHGPEFARFVTHDGEVTVEHWSIELPGTKRNIGRRENRGVSRG